MKSYVAGLVAVLTLVGASYVQASTCPKVEAFKQSAGNYGGFEYTVTSADGQKWIGEDPQANESDLKTLTFKRVTLLSKAPYVACEYEGGDKAGVRMTPDPAKAVSATGNTWTEGTTTSSAGGTTQACESADTNACVFK